MLLQGGTISDLAICEMGGEGAPVIPPPGIVRRYGTRTFVTASDDTPNHALVNGRIAGSFVLRRGFSSGPEGRFGGLLVASVNSEFVLANGDRALDELAEGYADGRPFIIKIGTIVTASNGVRTMPRYNSLTLAFTAAGGTFNANVDRLQMRVRDPGLLLQGEIQTRKYKGTGSRDGTAELKGRSKPLLIGRCLNVPAQLVDEELLSYQVTTANYPLEDLDVFDSGVRVPITVTAPSYGALAAADIDPGKAGICLAAGFFRLGIQPAGPVTVNAETTEDATRQIIERILLEAGVKASEMSITAPPSASADNTGYFQPAGANASIESVISQLASAAGAAFGSDRAGIYRLVWLDPEALTAAPAFTFNDRTILAPIERVALPYGVPWRSWVVGAKRNWTVQGSGELALNLTSQRRQFLEKEFTEALSADPDVAARHRTSRETSFIPTFFSTVDPARNFANRMAAWYGLERHMYRFRVKTALCQVEIGDIVQITAPLWNLDSAKKFMVTEITDDLGSVESELTIFG